MSLDGVSHRHGARRSGRNIWSPPQSKEVLVPYLEVSPALEALRNRIEIIALGVLSVIAYLIYAMRLSDLFAFSNIWMPIALAIILLASCGAALLRSHLTIWSPLFWFKLACAVYYGFGAVVPHVIDEVSLSQIYGLYYFDETQNIKVNVISILGISIVSLFSYAMIPHMGGGSRDSLKLTDGSARTFAYIFLIVGAILRYTVIIPYTLGLTSRIVPGSVLAIGRIYYAGIFLLAYLASKRGGVYATILTLLLLLEVTASVASFSKSELLFILIFPLLGIFTYKVTVTRLAIGVAVVVGVFFAFQPLVSFGRDAIANKYGSIQGGGVEERLIIAQDYFSGVGDVDAHSTSNLGRLSYVNVGAYVIEQYDSGIPGKTFQNAVAALVPRFLWKDKPVITQLGGDLYTLISNQTGSQLGIGHFAEAYWNFGWWGIPAIMFLLSSILCIFTKFSLDVMARRRWYYLPVVFLGVIIGFRVDGYFVPDVVGPAWTALVMGLAIFLLANMGRRPGAQRQVR